MPPNDGAKRRFPFVSIGAAEPTTFRCGNKITVRGVSQRQAFPQSFGSQTTQDGDGVFPFFGPNKLIRNLTALWAAVLRTLEIGQSAKP